MGFKNVFSTPNFTQSKPTQTLFSSILRLSLPSVLFHSSRWSSISILRSLVRSSRASKRKERAASDFTSRFMSFKRFLCTQTAIGRRSLRRQRWPVKQVTKSNFSEAFDEIKSCIFNSDYVAVLLQNTGSHSSPWQKILPIDTADTAYIKAKRIAERFQVLQFAVCPFSVKASKLIAHPYNFHLFPRDELKIGMPSYSFSCQSSCLSSMAREGFDFNACIYNGISYLSRAQESDAKVHIGHLLPGFCTEQSSSVRSVADTLFMERIKSRIKNWKNACEISNKTTEVADALINSMRKLISGNEVFSSRPSLNIDVCSERQVPLVLETLKEFDDVLPFQVAKGAGVQAVRVVLTTSEEDKNLLKKEVKDMEQENVINVRGFREVIDLLSSSQRPIVVHNSLNDFAFIHSKFLAPLPTTMDEFRSSLLPKFPHILDVNHLMKKVGPFDKMNNMPSAISYLESRFFTPLDMDFPSRGESDKIDIHGHNVLKICQLFVKLCSILKIPLEIPEGAYSQISSSLQCHSNVFSHCSGYSNDPVDNDVRIWKGNNRTVSVNNLVFLWGFQSGLSARNLKDLLSNSHEAFSEDFDIRMVDRTCAVVVFWNPGFSERFLRTITSGENLCGKLKDMVSEGLNAAGYEMYNRACRSSIWSGGLAECLDQVGEESKTFSGSESQSGQLITVGYSDDAINLDDL